MNSEDSPQADLSSGGAAHGVDPEQWGEQAKPKSATSSSLLKVGRKIGN